MLVSIGIPFFNCERYLEFSIISVLLQSYADWELLLLDDGSNDESLNIALYYSRLDSRIKVISDGINRGLVYRLNQFIDESRGEYLVRMDADDIMIHSRLERQCYCLNNNLTIDIVSSGAYIINESGVIIGEREVTIPKNLDNHPFFRKSILIHPSIMVRRSWYLFNRYDPQFVRAEDFELFLRTRDNCRIHHLQEGLIFYREGRVNVSNYLKSMKSLRLVYLKYFDQMSIQLFLYLYLLTFVKSLFYFIFGLFSLQHVLANFRNVRPHEGSIVELKSFLNSVESRAHFVH